METDGAVRLRRIGLILLAALTLLVFFKTLADNQADFDLWWRLATGKLLHESGKLPLRDSFSYLPTLEPWIQHGWLTNLALYFTNLHFGGAGLQVLRWLMVLGTAVLCFLTTRQRGASALSALLCLLLTRQVFSFGFPVIRAQESTYFLFVLFICILEWIRRTGRWRYAWLLAPLLWLWANLHPGFLAGCGIMALYAAGQWRSPRHAGQLALVAAAGCALTLLNPYGLDYWREAVLVSAAPNSDITEWMPVWVTLFRGDRVAISRLFVGLALLTGVLALWRRRIDFTGALVLFVTAALSMQHNRHIVFFGLAFTVFVPELVDHGFRALEKTPLVRRIVPNLGAFLVAGYLFYCFMGVPQFLYSYVLPHPLRFLYLAPLVKTQVPKGMPYYPVESLMHLRKAGLKGNLATHLAWGGLMVWAAYPDCRVAFDGRNESVFTMEAREKFMDFMLAREGWHEFLERYHTDLMILKPYSEIGRLMLHEPGWGVEYRDEGSMLLMRETSGASGDG